MRLSVAEASYPITFRRDDARALGDQIKNRHSVVLIGMKRVGISNFLRFFLYHKGIQNAYVDDGKKHLFIPIDLNDLVEREIYPFWVLTQKRILDAVRENNVDADIEKQIENLFLNSIQSKDLFITIDNVRRSLMLIIQKQILPTLFLIRFDRMKDCVTLEFFDNLQGLVSSTNHKVSYVFTSVRSLDNLSPSVFKKSQVFAFAHNLYIRPAKKSDTEMIYSVIGRNYKLHLSYSLKTELLRIVDGYAQYLIFAMAHLFERKDNLPKPNELFTLLSEDERIALQSEELWESLTSSEQETLIRVQNGEKIGKDEKRNAEYLFKTGIISGKEGVFSPLFSLYVRQKIHERTFESEKIDLTRKENLFLKLLESTGNEVCERDQIIRSVWPETESLGVSDWAIDRLVARLRAKLKMQNSKHEIVTVKTRGYKLLTQP
jgi:DNA-binding winged helix-turn-helix (wHTH) protein